MTMVITDLSPYRQYLDDFDLTDEQKLDLVNTMQTLAYIIVDRHFGLHRFAVPVFPKKPVDTDAVTDHAEMHKGDENAYENET